MGPRLRLPNLLAGICDGCQEGWLTLSRVPLQVIVVERHHQSDCVTIPHENNLFRFSGMNDVLR
jgi:hypothetical protein